MSSARQILTLEQEPFLAVRSLACNYSSRFTIQSHHHPWHQLLYAIRGAMTVHAEHSSWMIPPGRAVFIPAERVHTIRMWGEVSMRSLAFPEKHVSQNLFGNQCRVLSVSSLLRELILRIVSLSALDTRVPAQMHLFDLLLDEMTAASIVPLMLPLPADLRALAIAQFIANAPAGEESIVELSHRFATSRRTIERMFRHETGMSFGIWRQKVRLLHSIRLLSEGKSVTDAALDSGYTSVSAFIAAFKSTFGCTPGQL